MNHNIKELSRYLAAHIKHLVLVLIALSSVAISLLAMGFVFRQLIDQGLSDHQSYAINTIDQAIYIIFSLVLIFAGSSFCRSYFINLVSVKVMTKIRADAYYNLLNTGIETFEMLKLGDIITRLGSDIELIGTLITNFLSFFIRNTILLIGSVVMMFTQSTKLSLFVLFGIPILLLPLMKLSKNVRSLSKAVLEQQSSLLSIVEESIVGIRTIYAYNQQDTFIKLFDKQTNTLIKAASRRIKLRSMFFALAISLVALAITTVIWIGSIDIIQNKITSGQMISFIYYAIMVGMSAGGIAELLSEMHTPFAALERVLAIKNITYVPPPTNHVTAQGTASNRSAQQSNSMATVSMVNTMLHNNDINPACISQAFIGQEAITYHNVTFAYPARSGVCVLDQICLEIKHGSFVAIIGKSGVGKSTLLQLLMKFYHPQKGQIFIGNHDIQLLTDQLIRSKIAYVEQDAPIFSGTVRDNLLLANPNCSTQEIQQAMDICAINDFVHNLDHGIDTQLGEKGVRLSGGQKQKIALARALLYEPEVLLLDEATSAIDVESEENILRGIRNFMSNKTVVIITHRMSTTKLADEIFVMHQGSITRHNP